MYFILIYLLSGDHVKYTSMCRAFPTPGKNYIQWG